MTVANILSQLTSLNAKELATVKAAINQLLKPPEGSPEALSLYEAVRVAAGSTMPYDRLKLIKGFVQWGRHSARATSFIERTWPQVRENKMMRMALERLLVGLLVADLKDKGVELSVGALVRNLGRLSEVFEDQFPGYKESQLQGLVLKAMEKAP